MPFERCTLPEGGRGWRWGTHGKCYKDKSDADKQRKAVEWSKHQAELTDAFKYLEKKEEKK